MLLRTIELQDFPEDVSDYQGETGTGRIAAVHIRYIAIAKRFQQKKIGTCVLRAIIKRVQELSEGWPIRVITIDARNELVKWYEKEGFRYMSNNSPGQDGVTTAMYYDCFRYAAELEAYESSFIE